MRVLFLALVLLFTANLQAQTAKVRKVNGLDIYIYSEPVREYVEVFEGSGAWNWGELQRATIDNIVETIVRNVKKKNEKAKKKGEPIAEAIIIYDNDRASAIRYTDKDDKSEAKN